MMAVSKAPAVSPGGPGSPDKLPVVELKPFTAKEWRPSNSLPEFGSRRSNTANSISSISSMFSATSRKSGASLYSVQSCSADSEKSALTPRNSDMASWRSFPEKASAGRTPRPREGRLIEQRERAFAPTVDREKTTKEDIKSGQSDTVKHGFIRRTQSEVVEQQDMSVRGTGMTHSGSERSKFYSGSWQYYKVPKSYSVPATTARDSSAQGQAIEDLCLRIEHLQQAYVDDGIYDAFDRSSTLPSITVSNAPMRRKKNKKENLKRQTSAKVQHKPAYQLGVANSLDVLRHYGKPARVERQLTMQLKNSINNLRRSKDLTLAPSSSHVRALVDSQVSPGEFLHGLSLESSVCVNTSMPARSRHSGRALQAGRLWNSDTSGAYGVTGNNLSNPQCSRNKGVLKKTDAVEQAEGRLFQKTGTLPYINKTPIFHRQTSSTPNQPTPELVINSESIVASEKMPKISEGGSKSPVASHESEKTDNGRIHPEDIPVLSTSSSVSSFLEIGEKNNEDAIDREEETKNYNDNTESGTSENGPKTKISRSSSSSSSTSESSVDVGEPMPDKYSEAADGEVRVEGIQSLAASEASKKADEQPMRREINREGNVEDVTRN